MAKFLIVQNPYDGEIFEEVHLWDLKWESSRLDDCRITIELAIQTPIRVRKYNIILRCALNLIAHVTLKFLEPSISSNWIVHKRDLISEIPNYYLTKILAESQY